MEFILSLYTVIALFLVFSHFIYQTKPHKSQTISTALLWASFIAAASAAGIYGGFLFGLCAIALIVLIFIFGKITRSIFSDWNITTFLITLLLAVIFAIPLYVFLANVWNFGWIVLSKTKVDSVIILLIEGLLLSFALIYFLMHFLRARLGKKSIFIAFIALFIGAPLMFLISTRENALQYAVGNNHPLLAKILIKAGFPINDGNKYFGPPLVEAALNGHNEVVKVLIAEGANLNGENEFGHSALSLAAGQGHIDVVRELLKAGANPNQATSKGKNTGWTPIMQAIYLAKWSKNNLEIIKILLENGGNPNLKNSEGMTALMLAEENSNTEIAALLKSAL